MKTKQKLVIVGLGMAASRLLDELVKHNAQDRYEIVVFGDEKVGGYNRILLSHVLSGEQTLADIISHDEAWFDRHKIKWFCHRKVTRLYPDAKYLVDNTGECLDYDLLVLATGSLPIRADIKGNHLAGVLSFRDVFDVQQLLALQAQASRVMVIGAGLLGLEAAYGLVKQGVSVTVVHRSDRIMSQQLDHPSAKLLQTQLESLGIKFVLSAQISHILGEECVQAVQLSTGEVVSTQVVVMAMGIKPNIELAQVSGLSINRGIVVDDQLNTSVQGIYALGECSEFEGKTYGLVAPIYRQVSVLINHLCGDASSAFSNQETPTQLKVSGISLSSFGSPLGSEDTQSLIAEDRNHQWYRKIMLDAQDRVIGAVLLGNTQASQTIFQRYLSGYPLSVGERALAVMGQLNEISEGV